jgi:hypothetical protein
MAFKLLEDSMTKCEWGIFLIGPVEPHEKHVDVIKNSIAYHYCWKFASGKKCPSCCSPRRIVFFKNLV